MRSAAGRDKISSRGRVRPGRFQKTVGAGISPSASLSDQDQSAVATSKGCCSVPALILTTLQVAHPERQRPFRITPFSVLSNSGRRAIEGLSRPSWLASVRRWRSHAFRGPTHRGSRSRSKQACNGSARCRPQEFRVVAVVFRPFNPWPPEMT